MSAHDDQLGEGTPDGDAEGVARPGNALVPTMSILEPFLRMHRVANPMADYIKRTTQVQNPFRGLQQMAATPMQRAVNIVTAPVKAQMRQTAALLTAPARLPALQLNKMITQPYRANMARTLDGLVPPIRPWAFLVPQFTYRPPNPFRAYARGLLLPLQLALYEPFAPLQTLLRADDESRCALLEAASAARAEFYATGDPRVVEEFLATWLGLGVREGRELRDALVEGAIDMLVEADYERGLPEDGYWTHELRTGLTKQVRAASWPWRPIWHHQARGCKVARLDPRDDGFVPHLSGVELYAAAGLDEPSTREQLTDPSLVRGIERPELRAVLGGLDPVEREVVIQHSLNRGLTWTQAAAELGQPPQKGETVRRKLTRARAEVRRRQSQRLTGAVDLGGR